ncbi:MAG: type II toxin-antitoxin system PemK/MazF family toxin [Nanoarchaeota archaeon]|nr:type II toxin-antitoxin system PemK/MazF family toxin [Nanoarchaeota archaeon]
MKLNKFDIVLVDFPFSDLKKLKKRPALVLCSLEGENSILCQITTKRRVLTKYEVSLLREDCKGDIRFNSFIYTDMVFTLHKSLIYGKIGEIKSPKTKNNVLEKIGLIFSK